MSIKKSIFWVCFWMCIALAFNVGIYMFLGQEKALSFLGGYIIELSLSVDNLFLFLLIFESYKIPGKYQRRVLNYGIIGAIILRFIFVMLGITIVNKFHFVLYIFGFILIISGIKMMMKNEDGENVKEGFAVKALKKIVPVTDELHDEKFFIRKNNILYATPLLAILVLIESSDVIFAIDSIPAIFSITTDLFIVYTSNIFAILGLRSLYFILEKLHETFAYVKYGVALILCFTGIKLLVLFFHIEIPIKVSLCIILGILIGSIIVSKIISDKAAKNKVA